MTRYCTLADIALIMSAKALHELSNDMPNARSVDEAVVDGLIESASLQIDSEVRARYPTGFDPVPPQIRDMTARLVRVALYRRRPDGRDEPKQIAELEREERRLLERIRQWHVSLTDEQGIAVPAPARMQIVRRTKLFDGARPWEDAWPH